MEELKQDKAKLEGMIAQIQQRLILGEARYREEVQTAQANILRLQGALAYINDNIEARSKDGSTDKPKDGEGSGG